MPDKKHIIFSLVLCSLIAFFCSPATSEITAKEKYSKAESCYGKLLKNPKKQRYRDNWLSCIEKFQSVYEHDASGPWAAAGLYMCGKLYLELYTRSSKASDKEKALEIFEHIIKDFPKSQYRYRAAEASRTFSETESKSGTATKRAGHAKGGLVNAKPGGSHEEAFSREASRKEIDQAPVSQKAIVKGVRFWSNPSYTRVVVDLDHEAPYTHGLLKRDTSIGKPPRLYVDIKKSELGTRIVKLVPIQDNLLSDARLGQFTPDSVRVVVDIKSIRAFNIFSLQNPFRIVMDVWGEPEEIARAERSVTEMAKKDTKPSTKLTEKGHRLVEVKRIAIDAGHGGDDVGASGYLDGVYEKDVTLQIAKKLAEKLRQELRCEVVMTRDGDQHLSLEERTAIANTANADLFISVHTNAHMDAKEFGIETYFLNLATDDGAILVAARENATSRKNISDLQDVLNELMANVKITESRRLGDYVQESLVRHMRERYSNIKDKGVKQAPFYVLLGAQMPAILIQTSFITNARECKRLSSPEYQHQLCDAILNGVRRYVEETGEWTSSRKSLADRFVG